MTIVYISMFIVSLIFEGILAYKIKKLNDKFEDLHKEFGIVERIITPFVEWIEEVKEKNQQDAKNLVSERTV